MVMAEMKKPRETFVLARGDYRNQTEKVAAGRAGDAAAAARRTRRSTASRWRSWLVDPKHPLTARVAVNRFWQMYFGYGIVKTQEDFGVQGEPPVHPELLDWLATEFIRTGWDIRAMQRLIVTSATYRQSSKVTPALLERDPENRLLARGPRLRLPAEMIRDTALAASGLLNDEIGGPSVLPYQPEGLWEEMAFGEGFSAQAYEQSHGQGSLPPRHVHVLEADGAAGVAGDVRRARPREVHGAARADQHAAAGAGADERSDLRRGGAGAGAAQRCSRAAPTTSARIAYAFRLATARKPSGKETGVLREPAQQPPRRVPQGSPRRGQARGVGESPRDARLDAAELAAWTTVASAILNLDETITKQ